MGKVRGTLYVLDQAFSTNNPRTLAALHVDTSPNSHSTSFDVSSNPKFVTLWHRRLGHASAGTLKHVPLSKFSFPDLNHCEVCPLAKQSHLPFELIHVDL